MITVVRPGRFILFIALVLAFLVLVSYGTFKLVWGTATLRHSGELVVAEGDSANHVWGQLVAQGFTPRVTPWRYYAWRLNAASDIKAGTYHLTPGEPVQAVIKRLVTGDMAPDELTITYPEGFTLQQTAARTAARGIGTQDDFIQAATPALYVNELTFLREIPPQRDLEGYLFPDTYRVFADDTPSDVVRRMLTTFNEKFSADLFREAKSQGRTFDQIITMASILEREVQSDEDMARVAGVLWKRFDDGVGLDVDATTRYALDKWDQPLTQQDLEVDSPYNTRRYQGLPPGPISNPGLRAIVAAVRPEQSDYYYYLSAPNGETIFSRTLDEHNANKAKHLR